MPTKKNVIPIVLDDELLARIEDFRYSNRFPSRSSAIIYIIRKGLEYLQNQNEKKDT